MHVPKVVFLLEKMNRSGSRKSLIWKRTAVTGAILAAMAAPLIVMSTRANADLASAVDSGSYGPVVTIAVTDPDDPTPYWLVSTRAPESLAEAIIQARATTS